MHRDTPTKQAQKCYDKGLELYEEGENEKALAEFEKAVKHAPRWDMAYYYRGLVNCCLGHYDAGIEDMETAIFLNPGSVDAWYCKGMALELKGRMQDATIAYAEALKIDSSCDYVRDRLAHLWSSEARQITPVKEFTTKPLSAYDSDRRHVDISFEENEREQSKPVLRELPVEAKDLSMVALPEGAQRYITRVTNIIKNPKLAEECKLRRPSGVILEGPNGTGKTELAFALAGELGWNIVTASFGNFASKWLGQTENNLVRIFDTLKSQGCLPAVILFDEIDSIVRSKDGESRSYECSVVNTFITEINRLSTDAGLRDLFIIGTTNHINLIDPSIVRSGRLDKVAMPLPTLKAREQIFRIHFKDKPVANDVDFELLAHQTEGRTGADIAAFANEASYRLFEARLKNRRVKQITMDIMEDIIRKPQARAQVGGYA